MRATRTRYLVVAAALVALAGCGGSGSSTASSSSSATASAVGMTADQAVAKLQKAGLPMTNVVVYTAGNDENQLLGRPGEYIGKANWNDTRDSNTSDTYSVEVFASASDLNSRRTYVEKISRALALRCEYDTQHGLVLLRISCGLTPSQAQAYATALDS